MCKIKWVFTNLKSILDSKGLGAWFLAVCGSAILVLETTAQTTADPTLDPISPTVSLSIKPAVEPLGPSSRRTGLIISEIMYHPGPNEQDSEDREFVEIYNAQPTPENLGGFRLEGDIDYLFPAETTLQPGQFMVVARDVSAIQEHYAIEDVQGPWAGELSNRNGTLRLRNRIGAVLLEVSYRDRFPWPVAADGPGHSLFLSHASYGEASHKAWSASQWIGGTPGKAESLMPSDQDYLVISEVYSSTDQSADHFIEIYNYSPRPVDLLGLGLSNDADDLQQFKFSNAMILDGGQSLIVTGSRIPFPLHMAGDTLFLSSADGGRVLDAVRYPPQSQAFPPDGFQARLLSSDSWIGPVREK